MDIKTIGVLGVGNMGTGIVQVSAQTGYNVIVVDVEDKIIQNALKTIDKFLSKSVEKGKIDRRRQGRCPWDASREPRTWKT